MLADSLRYPAKRHPVQALLNLIKENDLRANVVLCAGDITNKISILGFTYAIQVIKEIQYAMKAKQLFFTLGNHDVASRSEHGDPFNIAKSIHPKFPFAGKSDNDQYWRDGFCLKRSGKMADFLLLNTAYDHYKEQDAIRGTFPDRQIERLDKYLYNKKKNNIRIALMHHHPVLHSFVDFEEQDVLSNGDKILGLLSQHHFSFVIHGHRHQSRIKRIETKYGYLHVFCAGSFSAYLNELWTNTRNVFHLLELNLSAKDFIVGNLRTWEFNYGLGWNRATVQSVGLPHIISIGPNPGPAMHKKIASSMMSRGSQFVDVEEILKDVPSLNYLLPDELENLNNTLNQEVSIKLIYDDMGYFKGIGKA